MGFPGCRTSRNALSMNDRQKQPLMMNRSFLFLLLAASLMMWVFPTLARFILTNRQIIHNAVIHMFARFPQTLLALAAAVGGFILAALVPQVLPLVTFFVPAFVVWYMSRTCVKRFRKFDGSAEEEAPAASEETIRPEETANLLN